MSGQPVFNLEEPFNFGWEKFKHNVGFFIGFMFATIGISMALSLIGAMASSAVMVVVSYALNSSGDQSQVSALVPILMMLLVVLH